VCSRKMYLLVHQALWLSVRCTEFGSLLCFNCSICFLFFLCYLFLSLYVFPRIIWLFRWRWSYWQPVPHPYLMLASRLRCCHSTLIEYYQLRSQMPLSQSWTGWLRKLHITFWRMATCSRETSVTSLVADCMRSTHLLSFLGTNRGYVCKRYWICSSNWSANHVTLQH